MTARNWRHIAICLCAFVAVVLGEEAMGKTADLTLAKKRKKDEFYTQLVDIENEFKHYKAHFKGKVVLCNCDDPRKSNFFKYFADNFEKLQLKRLIATCYKSQDVDLFSQGDCERTIFPTYRKEMKGLDWGRLYARYGERKYNPVKLDKEVAELMADKEVQRHGGIYEFLLSDRMLFGKLNLRTFDSDDMRVAYENQKGVCPISKRHFELDGMRGDHIKPWSKGGRTVPENLQMLCADCNARKSDKF